MVKFSQSQFTDETVTGSVIKPLVHPLSPPQAGELSLEDMLALYGYTASHSEMDTCRTAAQLPNMTLDKVRPEHEDTGRRFTMGGGTAAFSIRGPSCWTGVFFQDQMSEDAFAGPEEEDSSVDDLTPSVTSNNSDVLPRPPGTAAP